MVTDLSDFPGSAELVGSQEVRRSGGQDRRELYSSSNTLHFLLTRNKWPDRCKVAGLP